MSAPNFQNARRRGPKLAIPLDADVSYVRYHKFGGTKESNKKIVTAKAAKKERPIAEKVHLRFIPPALRRRSPWSEFLTEWLADCDTHDDATDSDSISSSSSGASSGDTVTTDFSSVSSPRNALDNRIIAPPAHAHPVPQQSQPSTRYSFRVPTASSQETQLSPAQWAELQQLLQHSQQPRQPPPPAKLMNIHTAYLPDLDAAVLQMMRPARSEQQYHQQASSHLSQPWSRQYKGHYQPPKGSAYQVASSSSGTSTAYGSEGRGRQSWAECYYCYQYAVNVAAARGGCHLPHIRDKGHWRGHVLKEGDTIVCPRLLRRICPLCGATGQNAHITLFCPATQKISTGY